MIETKSVSGQRCLVIDDYESLDKMVRWLGAKAKAGSVIGFDTETTSTRAENCYLVGMSFAASREGGFYIPVGHRFGEQLSTDLVVDAVAPVVEGPGLTAAGGKFDIRVMRRYGAEVRLSYDANSVTRLLGFVEYGVGVKPSVKRMYGEEVTEFTDLVNTKKGETFADVDMVEGAAYAVPDAINCWRLTVDGLAQLPERTREILLPIEVGVMQAAADMEDWGLPIDIEFVQRQIEAGQATEAQLYRMAIEALAELAERRGKRLPPGEINLNSTPQLREILFDICGLPPVKKSKKTGKPSADKASLERLAKKYGPVNRIAYYRSAQSVIGRLEEFDKFGRPERDWWYARGSLNPTGAATGRWSGSEPNTQNIPKEATAFETQTAEWRFKIRDSIRAAPGNYLVSADYSQIELRVAAGLSKCVAWFDAYERGDDIHAVTAAAVFGVPIEKVSDSQRSVGKTMNFSMLYGAEAPTIAERLGITKDAAQRLIDAFWSGLPEVESWASSMKQFTMKNGYSFTHFARRRYFPEIELGRRDKTKKWLIPKALREAVNHCVQGTAADILKIALVYQREKEAELGAHLFMVVHDQFVWEVPVSVPPDRFAAEMESVVVFPIKGFPAIPIDFSIGDRLGSLHTFETAAAVPGSLDEVAEIRAEVKAKAERVTVEVERAISQAEMAEFVHLVKAKPGEAEVLLRCSQGEFLLPVRSGLSQVDGLAIRAAIAGARVS